MDEHAQQLILAELNGLREGQTKMLTAVAELQTSVAVMKTQLVAGEKRFAACEGHLARTSALENRLGVLGEQVAPLKNVVYGGVALTLIAVAGAIIAMVVK